MKRGALGGQGPSGGRSSQGPPQFRLAQAVRLPSPAQLTPEQTATALGVGQVAVSW